MDNVLVAVIITAIGIITAVLLLLSVFFLGFEYHEAKCIERAKIMQKYNKETKLIICGTNGCKTE